MPQPELAKSDRKRYISNLALAAIAGQAGCLTLLIVLTAVLFGLWLDSQFQTRPILTIILVIASIPVSVISMYFLVRAAVSRIQFEPKTKTTELQEEETNLGTGSKPGSGTETE